MLVLYFLSTLFAVRCASDGVDYTLFGVDVDYSSSLNSANHLYDELFQNRNYHKDLAPINANLRENSTLKQRLPITVALQVVYVVNLDSVQQLFNAYIELELTWRDVRLAWNETEFDGLNSLWVQCDTIWVPADFTVNALDIDEIGPDRFKQCWFYSNGTVRYDMQYNARFVCTINVAKFPFDVQTCPIEFAASIYQPYQIDQTGLLFTKYTDTPSAVGNGEMNVRNVSLLPPVEVGGIDMLIYNVVLAREPSFYIYVIVIPCFLLTFLSIIGCFWTANLKGEQLSKTFRGCM